MLATLFPNYEKVLIERLNDAFTRLNLPITNDVLVTVMQADPQIEPQPRKQILVRHDGGQPLYGTNGTVMNSIFGITIIAEDYDTCNELARYTEAVAKTLTGNAIKKVDISLSPARFDWDGRQEARYMTIDVLFAGQNFDL